MTKQVQRRRGTSTQHTSFTGAEGEISVNTTNKSIHVHDGTTAGGVEAARADLANVSDTSLNNALSGNTLASLTITSADINGGTIDGTTIGGTSAAAITGTTITATGDVTIADKIIHAGDTNTAIRFPAADTVTVETSGTERLRVDSSGNLGVGTTSPGAPIQAKKATTGVETILNVTAATGAYSRGPAIDFSVDFSGEYTIGQIASQNITGGGGYGGILTFSTNGSSPDTLTEKMRIDASGNVGVGTSSPRKRLEVTSTAGPNAIQSQDSANSTNFFRMYSDVSSGAAINVNTGGVIRFAHSDEAFFSFSERMRIDSSGNVGIGTSSPGYRLQVYNNINGTPFAWGNAARTGFLYQDASGVGITNAAATTFDEGVYLNAADSNVALYTNTTERMRIDASGNVGLGTSVPSDYNAAADNLVVGTTSGNNGITIASGSADQGSLFFADGTASGAEEAAGFLAYVHSSNAMLFGTQNAERARIDGDGNLLVGTTSADPIASATNGMSYAAAPSTLRLFGAGTTIALGTNSASELQQFYYWNGSSNTKIGTISNTTTSTAYNTSSDYRLKENVQPMQDALAVIAQLNPVTYTWKVDGSDGQGFIAHELQTVVPDCVTGEKDAVDAEGNPKYQGVDTSFLVATLVKAVQELTAKVASLEAQLNP